MAQVTRLDEDNVGVILTNIEAQRLIRLVGNHVSADVLYSLYNALYNAKIEECPEEMEYRYDVIGWK